MCRYLLLILLLIDVSIQIHKIDPYSGTIDSDVIRKKRSNNINKKNNETNTDTQHTESNLNTESNNTTNDNSIESNDQIPTNTTNSTPNSDNQSNNIQHTNSVDNPSYNPPLLPGSREDDPLTVLQSNQPLEKETEQPRINNSNVKYAGVNHSDTYVTNNFYNGKHQEEQMLLRYLWMRIYALHDAIEGLPPGIKKMQDMKLGEDGKKKNALVITMDEKPKLTIDT